MVGVGLSSSRDYWLKSYRENGGTLIDGVTNFDATPVPEPFFSRGVYGVAARTVCAGNGHVS